MKLRRKLLSAGFALGATALTLTTSTFAWYTANTEVKVNQITGATSTEADTSSIYIAAAKTYNSTSNFAVATMDGYGKTATPVYTNAELATTTARPKKELRPVSYLNGSSTAGSYVQLLGATASTTTATTLTVPSYDTETSHLDYYQFVLRFRTANATTEATKIYFSKFDLANTASATDYQQVALTNNADTGADTGVSTAGKYGVDFRKALKMTITATDMTNNTTLGSTSTTKVYNFKSIGYEGDLALHTDVNISAANAVGYLNKVMNYDLSTPSGYDATSTGLVIGSSLATDTAYSPFSIPTTGYLEVRFTIWLDGWDPYCYDVCRKQGFKLDMAFTTSASAAVIKTA